MMSDQTPNSPRKDPRQEVVDLANCMCDQSITAEQIERLNQLLDKHPEHRPVYLDYLRVNAALVWRYRTGDALPAEERVAPESDRSGDLPAPRLPTRFQRFPWNSLVRGRWGYFAALACGVLVVILLYSGKSAKRQVVLPNPSSSTSFVATLREATHPVWSNEDEPVDVGSRINAGSLHLDEGEAELVFDSGAKLFLIGPTELELESSLSAFLARGTVAAHMPPTAMGFQLRTPTSMLVDQGTEFGVVVADSGSTQVQVFRGQVDLRYDEDESDSQATLEMFDRHAREIAAPGSIGREIAFSNSQLGGLARRVAEPVEWKVAEGGNGHFYQLVVAKESISWHDAARLAMNRYFRGMPGHLATLTSREEDEFVVENFIDGIETRGIWMGLTDVLREGHFRWVTGEPLGYTNWASWPAQQPDDFHEADWHGGEDYGMYTSFPDKQPWAWNDLSIDSMHEKLSAFMVEYEPQVDALKNRSMALDPIHWSPEQGGNGHYYRVVMMLEPTNWQSVRQQAEETELFGVRGRLVALESEEERGFVVDGILRVCGVPEMMIGLSGSLLRNDLRWINGHPVEGFNVERSHLPTDEVYGVFRWNPAGKWQTGWEIYALSMDALPGGWFGYIVEYPVESPVDSSAESPDANSDELINEKL